MPRSETKTLSASVSMEVWLQEINSLVAQDVLSTVLHQLPDVTSLDREFLQVKLPYCVMTVLSVECVFLSFHLSVETHIHAFIHSYVCMHKHACMHTCAHTHTHTHTCAHTHTHTYTYVTLPSKISRFDTFINSDFYTVIKSIHFPFKWYQNYASLPTGSQVIDRSIWLP